NSGHVVSRGLGYERSRPRRLVNRSPRCNSTRPCCKKWRLAASQLVEDHVPRPMEAPMTDPGRWPLLPASKEHCGHNGRPPCTENERATSPRYPTPPPRVRARAVTGAHPPVALEPLGADARHPRRSSREREEEAAAGNRPSGMEPAGIEPATSTLPA